MGQVYFLPFCIFINLKISREWEIFEKKTMENEDKVDLGKGVRADGLGHPMCFIKRRRYYISFMTFLGYVFSYSTRVNLSIAILYMTESRNETLPNGTIIEKKDFDWSEETQSVVLGSFFYGYLITQIPGGYLAGVIGGNHVLNLGVAGSGIISFLGPLCVSWGVGPAVVMRVLCGLLQGVTVPASSALWARWAPPLERTILSTIAISGNFFSSIIIMPICSVIGDNIGWEWMFYIFGIVSLVWSIIWGFTVFAGPEKDPFITKSERDYIEVSIGERTDKKIIHPWRKIFSSMPVGAIVVAQTGHNWGYYTMLLYGPKFYKETLDYSVKVSALFTGISFTITGILMQIFGQIADTLRRKKIMTTLAVRKLFSSTGFAIQGSLILVLAFVEGRELCVALSILAIGMGGINWSAFCVNPLDIAAPHAGIISGIVNTAATFSGIFSPMVAAIFIPNTDQIIKDWMYIWIICGGVYVFSGLFFLIFAAGEKQPWVYTPPTA